MDLGAVYSQIAILFLLIIGGYALGKLEIITKEMVQNLTTFILKISTPALIVGGMMIPRTPEKLESSRIMLISSFIIYAGAFILGKIVIKVIKVNSSDKGVFRFGMMFPNVGFMGFPVIQALFGQDAIFYAAIFNIPFNILVYTVGVALVNTKVENYKINMKTFINPGVIASVIGFLIFVLSIPITPVIKDTVVLIGSTTTPISMLVIGSMLSVLPISTMFNNWRIYVVSIVRVFVIPLLVYYILKVILNVDNIMVLGIPVMLMAMPVATNAALIAQEYGGKPEIASQCIFISTLMSIVSIPLLSLLFI